MNEKIAWYQEVLELEPSSKIFFALARLLQREGSTLDAIEVLRAGLIHHKDFLEARLMLIELLHSCGNEALRDAEVRVLLDALGQYPQFWHAWSACLASDGTQNELSLAMRFIAASQHCAGLSFASLLDKGLQTLEAGLSVTLPEKTQISQASPNIESTTDTEVANALHDQTVEQDVAILLTGKNPQATAYPFGMALSDASFEEESNTPIASASLLPDSVPEIEQELALACEPVSLSVGNLVVQDYSQTEVVANDTTHILRKHSAEIQKKTCFSSKDCGLASEAQHAHVQDSGLNRMHTPCRELFTLRTRSMADVLVSQGDIQGALSIYEELLSAETSEVRRSEIITRLEDLRHNKVCTENDSGTEESFNGKDKLLQMLTLLAERLETRAQ